MKYSEFGPFGGGSNAKLRSLAFNLHLRHKQQFLSRRVAIPIGNSAG